MEPDMVKLNFFVVNLSTYQITLRFADGLNSVLWRDMPVSDWL